MSDTTYIVLRGYEDPNGAIGKLTLWDTEPDPVEAANAADAIRKVAAHADKPAGTYVAVPKRSWKPVTVEAVQTTVLRLS